MKARLPVSPEERAPLLAARREVKMSSSAHAYVRGSTKHFYEWLASTRGKSLPDAPTIWIGGDCHIGNLGPVAGKDGKTSIQLRDLDQTVMGSPAHDVVRLSLSLAMAIRASGLSGAVTARAMEGVARGYEAVLESYAARREHILERPPAKVIDPLKEARSRSRRELLAERIGKKGGAIPMGKRFWPLTNEERAGVEKLIATRKVKRLLLGLTSRSDHAPVKLVDAAFWVKGCSSLGLWRAAALVKVGRSGTDEKSLALIDIKEAPPPLAPRGNRTRVPKHNGERVVAGARALSPALGERMAPASVMHTQVFVRELLPQDLKFELETLQDDEALAIAHYLGSVVAVAHARQLDSAACARWLESFRKGSAKNMDAPGWLWAAVVDLVALHEGAYLEHCRKHALPLTDGGPQNRSVAVSHHVDCD